MKRLLLCAHLVISVGCVAEVVLQGGSGGSAPRNEGGFAGTGELTPEAVAANLCANFAAEAPSCEEKCIDVAMYFLNRGAETGCAPEAVAFLSDSLDHPSAT